MCRSIECPSCNKQTYHKGTCENPTCSYHPLSAHLDLPDVEIWALTRSMDVKTYIQESPFLFVRFYSDDEHLIQEFAHLVGYKGPFFENSERIFFTEETYYGFDLVKDKGKQAVAIINYLVASNVE